MLSSGALWKTLKENCKDFHKLLKKVHAGEKYKVVTHKTNQSAQEEKQYWMNKSHNVSIPSLYFE